MKVLLDHNLPVQLKPLLSGHSVFTAREIGWDVLKNGALLVVAEEAGFQVMVTGDQNLSYQQNNRRRTIALVVLTQIRLSLVIGERDAILKAIARAFPGSYELVRLPNKPRERNGRIDLQWKPHGRRITAMANLDWSQCSVVESVPGKLSGAWVLRGTRMPVSAIFENIAAGANIDDLMEWFDGLDREQVRSVIEFAAHSLDRAPVYAD